MVQPTDQLGVANSEGVERTVGHDDGAIDAARLVGMIGEDANGEVESRIGRGRVVS